MRGDLYVIFLSTSITNKFHAIFADFADLFFDNLCRFWGFGGRLMFRLSFAPLFELLYIVGGIVRGNEAKTRTHAISLIWGDKSSRTPLVSSPLQ